MGLAYDSKHPGQGVHAHLGGHLARTIGAVFRDGLLVAATAALFGSIGVFRYGWDAMTESGQSLRMLTEFAGVYLFGALVLATAWMVGRRLIDREAAFERSWPQGYLVAVTLLMAVIALVPPIWD